MENNVDIKEICQKICQKYQLGNYKKHIPIDTGMEDLNYCLLTENKKYLIKQFNKNRSSENVIDYLKKYKILEENKIATPKIIKEYQDEFFVILMEYIEGQDLYTSSEKITKAQVKKLIEEMKKIHQIPNQIPCIYDEYHLSHFDKTYELCYPYLEESWKKRGEFLRKEYHTIDFTKMPKSFIHGDLHKGNIMKDQENNLYLIDFSSCGYSYRMLDIIEFINNTLFDYREVENSIQRIKFFLENYELTVYEKENLKILCQCYAFQSYILKYCDWRLTKKRSKESAYWMRK